MEKNNIKFITTSTTGVYGQPAFKIPEGFINAKNGNKKDIILLVILVDLGITLQNQTI